MPNEAITINESSLREIRPRSSFPMLSWMSDIPRAEWNLFFGLALAGTALMSGPVAFGVGAAIAIGYYIQEKLEQDQLVREYREEVDTPDVPTFAPVIHDELSERTRQRIIRQLQHPFFRTSRDDIADEAVVEWAEKLSI